MTRVAAIVGPTAVGKTELSIAVADEIGAEIVSVDSMQVYRGMDIGTAKPAAEKMERVRHHMVDVFDPSHDVTVSEFQSLARAAVSDIHRRGNVPLLVGGSGLYYRAVVDDLVFPPRAPAVRRRLEDEVERLGPEALHTRLADLDPAAAAKIETANARRTIRALEVIEITGRPFSDNAAWDAYDSVYELAAVGVSVPREALYERIAARVDAMLAGGLAEEVHRVADGVMSRTARQALGYKQILDGPGSPAIRDEIVVATKRFARRQESWFRSDPRVIWFDGRDPGLSEAVVEHFRGALALPLRT